MFPAKSIADLKTQLAALQKQQSDAFELSVYIGMSLYQQQAYERRSTRIGELKRTLARTVEFPKK